MSRGYLTLAAGREGFLEMAVDMALSLREHTDLPLGLVADRTLADRARARYPEVFDEVSLLGDRFREGRVRKYGVADASPFDEVVFVDADCIVLGPLDDLFAPLAQHPIAMLGERLGPGDDENHHGFSTRWLMDRFGLERYLKTNSGVFAFRRAPALGVMESFRRCFLDEAKPALAGSLLRRGWLGDEIAIGIVGGRNDIATLPPPHPMFWPQEFEALDVDRPAKPLLHFIWPPPRAVLERLLGDMRKRRRAAGLPEGTGAHWRAEVRSLRRMRWRRRVLERVGWW